MPKRHVALGWAPHTGWAVLVAVRGTEAAPEIVHRDRVQLVDDDRDRFAYHAAAQEDLTIPEATRHIARVKRLATRNATAATKAALRAHGADRVAVLAKPRDLPDDLAVILAAHSRLHAAEGALYEGALLDAANAAGVQPLAVDPRTLVVPSSLDAVRAAIGSPWQADHKIATAAALLALATRH